MRFVRFPSHIHTHTHTHTHTRLRLTEKSKHHRPYPAVDLALKGVDVQDGDVGVSEVQLLHHVGVLPVEAPHEAPGLLQQNRDTGVGPPNLWVDLLQPRSEGLRVGLVDVLGESQGLDLLGCCGCGALVSCAGGCRGGGGVMGEGCSCEVTHEQNSPCNT